MKHSIDTKNDFFVLERETLEEYDQITTDNSGTRAMALLSTATNDYQLFLNIQADYHNCNRLYLILHLCQFYKKKKQRVDLWTRQ